EGAQPQAHREEEEQRRGEAAEEGSLPRAPVDDEEVARDCPDPLQRTKGGPRPVDVARVGTHQSTSVRPVRWRKTSSSVARRTLELIGCRSRASTASSASSPWSV